MAVRPKALSVPPVMLERLRSALASVRPGLRRSAARPAGARPRASITEPSAEPARAVIFVTVFGLSTAALEEVLEVVLKETREQPVSPVFLTDSLDFKPFRDRRLRFEYLPHAGARQSFAPDLDWATYERRRYRLLAEKWRPQSLISFGTPPSPDCAAAIRSVK